VSLRVQWVRYGRPAAQALRDAVSAVKGDDPLSPLSVIVPSNHVGVATRRLLASGELGPVCSRGSGLAAVTFLTVYRLAERLGSSPLAGAGRRPVSTPVIAAALRAALREAPGIFAPVATHPATEMALVAAYRELRDVSPGAADAISARSARAADVVRLQREARARLEHAWYDEEDLMDAAVAVLGTDEPALEDLGQVIVYLPERLTRHGAHLLRTVANGCELVALAGSSGDGKADADVALAVGRLRGEGDVEVQFPVFEPLAIVDAQRTRIVTVSDADEEVREAVRAVVDAARAGTPLDRIAILYANPEPYARLAYEQLSAAGIALNGTSAVPLTARVAGRTLLGLLALADGDFRRDEFFAWLAGARLRHGGRSIPVTAWERISRDAGVVSGRAQWDLRLTRFAEVQEASAAADAGDPDVPPWRAERSQELATKARALRAFVLELRDEVTGAGALRQPWSARSAWARNLLDGLLDKELHRQRWPLEEQRAAERVERALDRLACLDEVEEPTDLEVFTRSLELELEADLGRVGRMGEGVMVAPVSMGVGLDLELLVVLGLAEGSFPSPIRDDTLLPDHERQAAGAELPLRAGRVGRQHRELLAALAGARRQLLYVPRGDLRRSQERVPSRWVLDIASKLEGKRWWSEELFGSERDWLAHVASFDAGLRAVAIPAFEQEYRLRALMAQPRPADGGARGALGDPILAAGIAAVAARRSARFTRFDGNLGGLAVPSPIDRVTSATRLEGWATCPFAHLLRDILRVEEVENPEEELEITPRDRGSLVHDVLERFIGGVLARPEPDQPSPSQAWSEADLERLREIASDVFADYEARGLTGRAVFWERAKRRILVDLLETLERDNTLRAERRSHPIAAELSFGMARSRLDTVALRLTDGRSIRFRGMADRVDMADDGTIHVVDYKTGGASGYKKLSEDDPDLRGTKLQLPVYGQAARALVERPDAPVRAEYWFVSTKGNFDRIGYPVTADVLERVGQTLQTVVGGIEAGMFPNFPTADNRPSYVKCPYCDPDALGVADLQRAWARKRTDPHMALFVDLADPEPDVEVDAEVEVEVEADEEASGG